jgi:hypothetical protein
MADQVPLSDTEISLIPEEPNKKSFTCDECDFSTDKSSGLKIHIGKLHKKELKNPEYDNYFVEKVDKESKCFKLTKTNKMLENRLLCLIHSNSCWESETQCSGQPNQNELFKDEENEILNIIESAMIKDAEIDWQEMYSLIVGFELEDWK